ncbi:AAA family ATPase, partial [Neisseria mucosa]|nr:AAA family ATPase [Neisseria mucosa]
MELATFLQKAYSVLDRLDLVLPEKPGNTDWNALAYRWHSVGKKGILESQPNPHT